MYEGKEAAAFNVVRRLSQIFWSIAIVASCVAGFLQVSSDDDDAFGVWQQNLLLAVIRNISNSQAMTVISALVGWASPNLISMKCSHHDLPVLLVCTPISLSGIHRVYHFSLSWPNVHRPECQENDLKAGSSKSKAASISKENDSKPSSNYSKDDDGHSKNKQGLLIVFQKMSFEMSPLVAMLFCYLNLMQTNSYDPSSSLLLQSSGLILCTVAAVIRGKSLGSRISERLVTLSGGFLFLIFGFQSLLSLEE
ncbi:hypothetical protein MLD38_022587 [Melastoma candidum]|uniref:Uncharacterized protein n=1 Tax=Melastoma candidum TaxID=119954 RepID=A0ACB9QIX2_9MYRT|nr:hypothetical protein MLD38_022587 [Melastoma candidum]